MIKEIIGYWMRKTLKGVDKDFSDRTVIGWNLYGQENFGDAKREFYKVHLSFKYKFLMPLILVARRILGDKKIVIPVESYNRNLKVFDKAYDKSVSEWSKYYLVNKGGFKTFKKCYHVKTVELVLFVKKLLLRVLLNDSAYRELFNIFSHNFAQAMVKEYDGQEVKHIFYTSPGFADVKYYVMVKVMEGAVAELDGQSVTFKYERVNNSSTGLCSSGGGEADGDR